MYYIGVIGARDCGRPPLQLAEEVGGAEVARRGAVLICGGGSGVMEAASRGAMVIAGGRQLYSFRRRSSQRKRFSYICGGNGNGRGEKCYYNQNR